MIVAEQERMFFGKNDCDRCTAIGASDLDGEQIAMSLYTDGFGTVAVFIGEYRRFL